MIYAASPSSAELICKVFASSPPLPSTLLTKINIQGLLNVPLLEVSSVRVTTRLPMALFNDIQKHGEGKISPTPIFQLTCLSHCIIS